MHVWRFGRSKVLAFAAISATMLVGVLLWSGCGGDETEEPGDTDNVGPNTLLSKSVSTAPKLDGQADDAVWADAPAMEFLTAGGANSGTATGTVRSVHTDDSVYFLVQWSDPTESLRRFPWVKQADGSWKQLKTGPSGDENEYYEDKLAIIWNINDSIAGFDQAGCNVFCHVGEAGKPYGNKYTTSPGEKGDIWHWKAVRSNPEGYVDDQYLDDTRYDPEKAKGAGRHGDPKDSGGYKNNVEDGHPKFGAKAPPYWIHASEAQPFNDGDFVAGDEVPGIIVERPEGDAGDIDGKGVYSGNGWTVEIGRKLTTGSEFDVQFADLTKSYHFGIATFDNAQVRHNVSSVPFELRFE